MGTIAADSEPQMMPIIASPKQTDAINNRPHLTWGVVNGLLPTKKEDINQDELDVKVLVEAFGKTLQKVSLSAPKDVVAASIEENYGDYVYFLTWAIRW